MVNNLKDEQKSLTAPEYLSWELIFFSLIAGVIGIQALVPRYVVNLPYLPIGGAIGGLIGGILVGISPLSPWMVSKNIKVVLRIAFIASLIYVLVLYQILALFIVIPGLINSLVAMGATKVVCTQLQKSPVKRWLFLLLFVFGIAVVILSTGFFAFLGSAVFAAI